MLFRSKNHRSEIVNKLNNENLSRIYEYADVYHCENIEKIAEEFIAEATITPGVYDNEAACKYEVPSYWDIGKVYQRLITMVCNEKKQDVISCLINVYNSFISEVIEDYNCSMYYENPSYIYECYVSGEIL